MFVGIQKMKPETVKRLLDSVLDIVDSVNAGHCPEYKKAEYISTYPAMLGLWPTDGGKPITIQAVENMGKFVNGYSIDYNDLDNNDIEVSKHIFITLRQ